MWQITILWGNNHHGHHELVRQFYGSERDAVTYALQLQAKVAARIPYADAIKFEIEDIQRPSVAQVEANRLQWEDRQYA